jgi:hypothetical protein
LLTRTTAEKETAITPLIYDQVTFILDQSGLNKIGMKLKIFFLPSNARRVSSLHEVSLALQCSPLSFQSVIEFGKKPALGSQLNTKY